MDREIEARAQVLPLATSQGDQRVAADAEPGPAAEMAAVAGLPDGGLKWYWREKNGRSLDGLPGVVTAFASGVGFQPTSSAWTTTPVGQIRKESNRNAHALSRPVELGLQLEGGKVKGVKAGCAEGEVAPCGV